MIDRLYLAIVAATWTALGVGALIHRWRTRRRAEGDHIAPFADSAGYRLEPWQVEAVNAAARRRDATEGPKP